MHHSYIDKFAYGDSPIHRLDCRIKAILVFLYTVFVLSVGREDVSVLFCFAVWPFCILVIGRIPLGFVFKQILMVSGFVIVLALSCPLYETELVELSFGPFSYELTRGWVRFFVILLKFCVTMMALIALVSTTRFNELLYGLQKMGMPEIMVIQLSFLYRYIFVLIDKAGHILRARQIRKLRNLGFTREVKVAGAMVGSLFVRSLDSSERINMAMQARGFKGHFRSESKLSVGRADIYFVIISMLFLLFLRFLIAPMLVR